MDPVACQDQVRAGLNQAGIAGRRSRNATCCQPAVGWRAVTPEIALRREQTRCPVVVLRVERIPAPRRGHSRFDAAYRARAKVLSSATAAALVAAHVSGNEIWRGGRTAGRGQNARRRKSRPIFDFTTAEHEPELASADDPCRLAGSALDSIVTGPSSRITTQDDLRGIGNRREALENFDTFEATALFQTRGDAWPGCLT